MTFADNLHTHQGAHNGGGEMPISYGSVCSGIEAATTAWHPLGWSPRWFAEIEPFPSAVLAHHWLDVPNLGDFTAIRDKIAEGAVEAPDVLVGGTPCQAFSVAGLRQSLDDKRGQLTLEFVRLADAIDSARSLGGKRPVTVVWENVPGVLNTPDNAFGCLLGALAGEEGEIVPGDCPPTGKSSRFWVWSKKLGRHVPCWPKRGLVSGPSRTIAWRVLDAQWFGVAQRRRRVFLVASAGDGFCPDEVLFELDGVRRDSAPSREAGKGSAANASRRSGERSHWDGGTHPSLNQPNSIGGVGMSNQEIFSQRVAYLAPHPVAFGGNNASGPIDVSTALNACASASGRMDFESETFAVVSFNARQDPDSWEGRAGPLDTDGGTQAVAFSSKDYGADAGEIAPTMRSIGHDRSHANGGGQCAYGVAESPDVAHCLRSGASKADKHESTTYVRTAMQVRRLTPTECERLQGFPDGHTLIPWRGKPAEDCPDDPRYKALGNSMAVPVMRWIGARIARQLEAQA